MSRAWPVGLTMVALTAHCGARTELDAPRKIANGCDAVLASSPDWPVYASDTSASPLGFARAVCASASQPFCPAGALVYAHGNWSADITSVASEGAEWIWGDVSLHDQASLTTFVFARTYALEGKPHGSLSIAADDFAEVKVNGEIAGTIGSVTDKSLAVESQNALTTFDLTPHLKIGDNTIVVIAENGPSSYAGCGQSCDYTENPAGVVFGGTLSCDP